MPAELALVLHRPLYTYDVYTLLQAFWPTCKIRVCSETEGQDAAACCSVVYTGTEQNLTAVDIAFSTREPETAAILGLPAPEAEPLRQSLKLETGQDRLQVKNQIKRLLYRMLSEQTGRSLPWGSLTGIRPVTLVVPLVERGLQEEEALRVMQESWFLSEAKGKLAFAIATKEREILRELQPDLGYSLYIDIPFCPSICLYCSFGSHPLTQWQDAVEPYLTALQKELSYLAKALPEKKLTTIYIGGGTPTTLSVKQAERLLIFLAEQFPLKDVHEFTVEAGRPDTITEEKLRLLRQFPVSRISINPQTMQDRTLERIGRSHTAAETKKAFALAREVGFTNINMDLIVGLPGEGLPEVTDTLEQIREIAPDSLTVHALARKRASRLQEQWEAYAEEIADAEEILTCTADTANMLGMEPYYVYRQKNMVDNLENVGYARPGKEGLYNILMMEQRQTILAAGSGASTKLLYPNGDCARIENVKDLPQYMARVTEMIARKEAGLAAWRNKAGRMTKTI